MFTPVKSDKRGKLLITRGTFKRSKIMPSHNQTRTLLRHNAWSQKLVSAKQKKNAQSAKINSRKNFAPHGTPT